jgi:hypothetical protein
MASPPDPFSWTQAVPWLLSAGSLVWNWINSRRTSVLQRQTRTTTLEIEEFRRLRSALDAVIADFASHRDTLVILSRSPHPITRLRADVEDVQTKIFEVYFKLDTALIRADASSFAEGNDWQSLLAARWDQFGDKLNGLYKPNASRTHAQTTLEGSAKIMTEIIEAIEGRLDSEMKRLLKK